MRSPISWHGAPAIEVVLRDTRPRKRAEQAAHEWQKRLELAQKAGLRIGLWDWDVAAITFPAKPAKRFIQIFSAAHHGESICGLGPDVFFISDAEILIRSRVGEKTECQYKSEHAC